MKIFRIIGLSLLLCFMTLQAQDWEEITPDSGDMPSARTNATVVYDSLMNRMILFGGRAPSGDLNDIWAFDLAAGKWQSLMPTDGPTPAPRRTAGGAYDHENHRMFIWTGQGSNFFNDIWAFDLQQEIWTEFTPPDPKPNTRYGVAGVFDPVAGDVVTFAGFTSDGRFEDTWRFNAPENTWLDVTSQLFPPRRCLHSGSYDEREHRLIIYGGQQSGALDDIWALDLAQNTWSNLTPSTRPTGRYFTTNVYDRWSHRIIIFSGRLAGGGRGNDVWGFDLTTNTWQEIMPSGTLPDQREGAVAVYVPSEGRMVVFGGRGSSYYNDIWSLNNLASPTGIEDGDNFTLPQSVTLYQNYPNPFNPSTNIRYDLFRSGNISLKIYTVLGQEIRTLVSGVQPAGEQSVIWDGRDNQGHQAVSGVYIYQVITENATSSRKLVLLQ